MDGTCQYHWCVLPFPKANNARHMLGTHHKYFCHGEKKYVPVRYENGQVLHLCTYECNVKLGMWKTESGALAHQARARNAGIETDANHTNWGRNRQQPPVGPAVAHVVQYALPPSQLVAVPGQVQENALPPPAAPHRRPAPQMQITDTPAASTFCPVDVSTELQLIPQPQFNSRLEYSPIQAPPVKLPAAENYGVSPSTVQTRMKGVKTRAESQAKHQTLRADEEGETVPWLEKLDDMAIPPRATHVMRMVDLPLP
ncbi:hypothetical protein FN846DRAFT_914696 [Sphaerosporella brunnea]|uniref:Uncharacterized protein n=1 Tax=Sphaerosporella brunnea TaxID=1250544 RepID=A0A5J5EDV7_9PEZI|nr:hypothetical protein FN846DRAFT_914696 [Sphaerosporella brunnea]